MQRKISRRSLVKSGLIAGAILPSLSLLSSRASAAALSPLDSNDPTAKALGFVTDASKIDSKTQPTFKSGEKCGTCAQFQGKSGDATGPCTIFAGHSVPQGGWCQVWAQKT
jgi:hypothetical protein